ncbi:MAG: hypothetical protein U0132_00850 [Gemmatimonadaceae bacterium]
MHELKPITMAGVPAALQKANRYRLLNDSAAAESICEDILAIDPGNVDAIVTHALAITDQFADGASDGVARARAAVTHLNEPYKNAYYNGIICERWGKALLNRRIPRAAEMAFDWISQAMDWFAKAERLRPAGNDEAILRWNSCVRMLHRHSQLRPADAEAYEPSFE